MSITQRVRLPQPNLIDLTNFNNKDSVIIEIINTTHKFAPDALESGSDSKNAPIFGSIAYVNATKISETTFGLPFFRFKRGTTPHIKFINKTGYSFDLHWHGLNTTADIDGASTEVQFGVDTKIGTTLDLQFPIINNNSALLWFHAHPMFIAAAFLYTGVYGLLQIVDEISSPITNRFE